MNKKTITGWILLGAITFILGIIGYIAKRLEAPFYIADDDESEATVTNKALT